MDNETVKIIIYFKSGEHWTYERVTSFQDNGAFLVVHTVDREGNKLMSKTILANIFNYVVVYENE